MVSYVEFSNRDEEMMNRMLLETDTLLQVILKVLYLSSKFIFRIIDNNYIIS